MDWKLFWTYYAVVGLVVFFFCLHEEKKEKTRLTFDDYGIGSCIAILWIIAMPVYLLINCFYFFSDKYLQKIDKLKNYISNNAKLEPFNRKILLACIDRSCELREPIILMVEFPKIMQYMDLKTEEEKIKKILAQMNCRFEVDNLNDHTTNIFITPKGTTKVTYREQSSLRYM